MLRRQETGNPVTKGGKKGREIEISENRFKNSLCAKLLPKRTKDK